MLTTQERPNPLNLTPEVLGLFDQVLVWLDNGGDEQHPYNYSVWGNEYCGTSACIGGMLELLAFGDTSRDISVVYSHLGLPRDLGDALFFQGSAEMANWDVPADIAASCVRHMLATGEVDWQLAIERAA